MGSLLTSLKAKFSHKYQGVAPANVVSAVKKASQKTGVDFAFLMEKASTESGFDPKAKSKSSSATGLFQFIEDTWLSMVKRHGDRFGLGKYADEIEIKNGRCCVEDSEMKKKILSLRNDPEISALMAGAYSAENKQILEKNTDCEIGTTEMYLAHFMGAGGATKFLNCRDYDGDAVAAKLFPQQARANKNVFYDRATGRARTLDQVYNLFDKKFSDGPTSSPSTPSTAETGSVKAPAAAEPSSSLALDMAAAALPSFDDGNDKDDIIWSNDPRFNHKHASTGFGHRKGAIGTLSRLSPENILIMSEIKTSDTFRGPRDKHGYNS